MLKKFSVLGLFLILILSGCLEKQFETPAQAPQTIDPETQALLDNVEKKGGQNLTEAETKALEDELDKLENADMAKVNDEYNIVRNLENLEDAKKEGSVARGSCDDIDKNSVCLEYVGSFWTEEQMKMNCSTAGTFSLSPCPDDMAGGCDVGASTVTNMISWFYYRGNGDITPESLYSAQQVCNINPLGKWIVK